MKTFLNSTLVAFSMFSSIPVPQKRIRWDADGMKYMMASFPLVGVLIGAVVYAWVWFAGWLGLPGILVSLGLTLIPIALTGGIHLDGLADTSDALGANTTPERRREILKDPRAGAFAVIGIGVYLIAFFGLTLSFDVSLPNVVLLCAGFVMSRAMSGLAVVSFPSAGDGTAKMFRDAASKRSLVILTVFMALCLAAASLLMFFDRIAPLSFVLWYFVQGGCFFYLKRMARRKFGGMSGDLAGWFLQINELLQLGVIVVCSYWRFG